MEKGMAGQRHAPNFEDDGLASTFLTWVMARDRPNSLGGELEYLDQTSNLLYE